MKFRDDVEVNEFGVNKSIQINPNVEYLKSFGFTQTKRCLSIPPHLHWHKFFRYKDLEISFNIDYYNEEPYKGGGLDISVLDEDFCQPYDYQNILSNGNNEYALRVYTFVEETMEELQSKEILSGHIKGDYI